jgi:hypothetical protein
MSYQRIFISVLADFFLLGHWQSKVIIKNIYFMLQSRPTWVVPLVNRIFINFQGNLNKTSKNQLINFISHDDEFIQIWGQQRQELHIPTPCKTKVQYSTVRRFKSTIKMARYWF